MAKPVRILSIDGGGVRGLIPALMLAELEKITGKPIADLFDLIAGTSTGGIIALGLVKPGNKGAPQYTAQEMAGLYEQESQRIFARPLLYKIQSMGAVTDQKYPTNGIQNVLDKYFGDARLKQSITDVLIPSYEIERSIPFFFKSSNACQNEAYDFSMCDVARATSAAPTYFEPMKLAAQTTNDYFALIDGGVYANNPAMCALVEARTRNPLADDFLVVSLGTGMQRESITHARAKGWGLAQWAKPVFNIVMDGGSQTVDYQLRQLLPGKFTEPRYYRFQPQLDASTRAMDNADASNMRRLRILADALIRDHATELHALAAQLV